MVHSWCTGSSRMTPTTSPPEPERAIEHACSLLNRKDSEHLWLISAILSLVELFIPIGDDRSFFPTLNLLKLRAFCQFILESRASPSNTERPSGDDLSLVLNDSIDAVTDPDSLDRIIAASGTEAAAEEAARFFSLMASTQLTQQEEAVLLQVWRMVALLEILPTEHADWLPASERDLVLDFLPRVPGILGGRASDFSKCFMMVFGYNKLVFHHIESMLVLPEGLTGPNKHGARTRFLLDHVSDLAEDLTSLLEFDAEAVTGVVSDGPSDATMRAFLECFSRTTDELRSLGRTPPFREGHFGSHILPLERFPIVRGDKFAVPSMRLLRRSFPVVIDFTLFEAEPKTWPVVRGALQELYLRCLIVDRLPGSVPIPERPYGKPERRGPDLVITDPQSNRMVVVESKGRRIQAVTRSTMQPRVVEDNLAGAFAALMKCPQKISDLREGLAEYEDVQQEMDACSQPVCIAVLGESLFFLGELVFLAAARDESHPLHNLAYPACIMSIDTFERAVCLAAKNGLSLGELLEDHWRASIDGDPSTPGADQFGGLESDESDAYAFSLKRRVQAL